MSSVPLMTLHNSGRGSGEARDSDVASDEEDDPLESVLSKMKYRSSYHSHDFWSGLICATVIGFVLGFVFSYITFITMDRSSKLLKSVIPDADIHVASLIMENISLEKIKEYERNLSSTPAGNVSKNMRQAQILQQHLKNCDFDIIAPIQTSSLLLSYASVQNPNTVSLKSSVESTDEPFSCNASMEMLPPNVHGDHLSDEISVPVKCLLEMRSTEYKSLDCVKSKCECGKNILLVEYENTPIIDLVETVMRRDAAGIIFYSSGYTKNPLVTPLQLGIMQYMYQNPSTEIQKLTNSRSCIPVLVIDIKDATRLIHTLSSDRFPSESAVLNMRMSFVNVEKTFYNVVAGIRGSLEPDRYILLGSSRETYTDVEHSYSTATMMELARTISVLRTSKKWKPRRSLIFYNWGISQVFGHYNSSHFVDSDHIFDGKLVAYISLEIPSIDNEQFFISSSQLMASAVHHAWSYLPNSKTKLDSATFDGTLWKPITEDVNDKYYQPTKGNEENYVLQSMYSQGVPIVNLQYVHSQKAQNISKTRDTSVVNKTSLDSLKTATLLWGVLIWKVSDQLILPLNVSHFASTLNHSLSASIDKFKTVLGNVFDKIEEPVKEFVNVAIAFQKQAETLDLSDALKIRIFNDQLLEVEKSFFHHPETRNENLVKVRPVILDSSNVIQYSSTFDQLQKLLSNLNEENVNESDKEAIAQHLDFLHHCFVQATLVLKDPLQAFIS